MPNYLIAEDGPSKGLVLRLDRKKKYTIGRDADIVDYALEDSSVSRKHAICFKDDDGICIQDLSHTNPIFVNDQNIVEPHLLKQNDKIKIGHTTFKYSTEELKGKPHIKYKKNEKIEKNENETIYEPLEELLEGELPEGEPPEGEPPEGSSPDENLEKPIDKKENIYDTIFEEEPEDELPFSIISEYPFLLKVISGPNSGAEFGMEKNVTYILGKDQNICDIAFNDLSVSKEHAKIQIDENGTITIEDLNSKNGVIVNNEKTEKTQNITSQDLISLGTTSFLVIDQKASYETIYSEPPPPVKKHEPSWKEESIPSKYILIGGSAILVTLIMFISFFSLFKSKTIDIVKKEPTEEIQKALEKYEDVKFSFNPAGDKLFLVGHVLKGVDEQELFYNIGKIGFVKDIENNIIIDEYVWKNTNDIINDNPNWKGVSLRSKKAGIFILNGYLKNLNDLESLKDYLNTNFPYVDKLVYEVVVESVLQTEISTILLSNGLGSISYQLVDGELIIAGRYSNEKNFQNSLDIIKKTKGIRAIKNVAMQTTQQTAMVDLSSKYKITGYATQNKKNISVIINNKIFSIGDALDGMELTNIKINTIFLEKDGFKYKINYK